MDIATVIGLAGGTLLVFSAIILGGSALIFVNIPGLLIVFGGTIATCMIKHSLNDVLNSIKVAMKAFIYKLDPPEDLITQLLFKELDLSADSGL